MMRTALARLADFCAREGVLSMAMTEQEILGELRRQGVTSLEELARKAQDDVQAKAEAAGGETTELYVLTGKNYTFIHSD